MCFFDVFCLSECFSFVCHCLVYWHYFSIFLLRSSPFKRRRKSFLEILWTKVGTVFMFLLLLFHQLHLTVQFFVSSSIHDGIWGHEYVYMTWPIILLGIGESLVGPISWFWEIQTIQIQATVLRTDADVGLLAPTSACPLDDLYLSHCKTCSITLSA